MSPSNLLKLRTEPTKIGQILRQYRTSKIQKKKKTFNKSCSPIPIFFTEKNLLESLDQFSTLKNDFEKQNFEMFEEVVHNFGKPDSDII